MTRSMAAEAKLSRSAHDYIDDGQLHSLLGVPADPVRVRDIIAKSLAKEPLTVAETAVLVNTTDPELIESFYAAARQLKRDVYGNRIVLFAPLYVGNYCINDCSYCGFRRTNSDAVRRTLQVDEIKAQVAALQNKGHKRLIVVFGEHPRYNPEYIAETVRTIYYRQIGRQGGNPPGQRQCGAVGSRGFPPGA